MNIGKFWNDKVFGKQRDVTCSVFYEMSYNVLPLAVEHELADVPVCHSFQEKATKSARSAFRFMK